MPTAHDEKLHLLGSTAPPTSLLVHLMSSSVTSFLASSRCSVAPPPPGSLVLTKWSAVDARRSSFSSRSPRRPVLPVHQVLEVPAGLPQSAPRGGVQVARDLVKELVAEDLQAGLRAVLLLLFDLALEPPPLLAGPRSAPRGGHECPSRTCPKNTVVPGGVRAVAAQGNDRRRRRRLGRRPRVSPLCACACRRKRPPSPGRQPCRRQARESSSQLVRLPVSVFFRKAARSRRCCVLVVVVGSPPLAQKDLRSLRLPPLEVFLLRSLTLRSP